MRKIKFNLWVLCTLCSMQSSLAASTTAFITLDALALFSAPAQTQDVNLIGTLGNTYLARQQWHYDENIMLGLGLRTYQRDELTLNTSVRVLPNMTAQAQGNVLQLRSSAFDNLAYAYDISSTILFVENAITWNSPVWQPGLILGVGRAANTASNYHEMALSSDAAPGLAPFGKATRAQFAFEVGAVLDYPVNGAIIECAYRYMNAGQGRLGLSSLQTTNESLSTGALQYHVVSIGVRFERLL